MFRVASYFNRVIELKLKMLILLEFVTNIFFLFNFDNKTEFFINRSLQIDCRLKQKKMKYQMLRVASCFNRVIKLNQKMLIL
jgi:hypothetical protein